jgi:hypothetical protein
MNAAWFTPDRLSMASRVAAASIGAYVLVNVITLTLNFFLPWEQYMSLLFAMQISFVFYTLIIIWVFFARTATMAWLGLLAVGLPLALVDLASYWFFSRLVIS